MAARMPSLDQTIEARPEEYLPDHEYQYQTNQFATLSNGAQGGELALPQGDGSILMLLDAVTAQTWSDASRPQADASTLYIEHGGTLYEGHERVQSIPGVELDFGISEASASRHAYQEDHGDARPGNDGQLNLLTFPEGEGDAVTITASDLEGLQPARFLGNNMIDFYIKYLERSLSPEERNRFYFFSSFFFTKLLGSNSTAEDINECEVDFNQVRKWTREVNLFEKDYIFIPILRSAHWSLIIIFHLSTITSSAGERKVSPCIFHLDPVEGMHESFEGQVRRYLYRACRERYQASNEKDDMLDALAFNMKYVRAEVPRQDNSYDCGVYVLQYVEDFIRESISPDFRYATSKGGPRFTNPQFAEEVSAKREVIQNLIRELSNNPQERGARPMDIEPKPRSRAPDVHTSRPQCPKRQNKPSLSKKWNEKETSVLINRLLEGGRIHKGTKGPTHWNLISEDIHTKCETIRSEDECRRRFDTLLKAYRKIEKTGKPFGDITKAERAELNLATPLTEEWYRDIDRICSASPGNAKSRKRPKLDPRDGNGMLSSSPPNPTPPPVLSLLPERQKSSRKQVAVPGFRTLDEDLRSTLLNLFQASSMYDWRERNKNRFGNPRIFEQELLCQWLEIVQDRKPWDICRFIFDLLELKLVSFGRENGWSRAGIPCLKLSNLRVHKKFLEKVLRKNPDFDMYLRVRDDYDSVSFPKVPSVSLSLQRIRVLSLYECENLECAELSNFPELRSLTISCCKNLKSVTGWEVVKELGWLEISYCHSYEDSPRVQSLPSLRELRLESNRSSALHMIPVPDLSQCVRLRRLEIVETHPSALNSVDLSTLRFLEVLTLWSLSALTTIQGLSGLHSLTRLDLGGCEALPTIQGLSGLHSLTELELGGCEALRRVPELGCLKALTHLDMPTSGVEEIPGVQELHLLTRLDLTACHSLKTLPWLGHLKALAYLSIRNSGVEEIPGVENLVRLETLYCEGSRLKGLPDLHHLPRLPKVGVPDTPLLYYGKRHLEYTSNGKAERMGFVDEISDISDTEYNSSDDDSY